VFVDAEEMKYENGEKDPQGLLNWNSDPRAWQLEEIQDVKESIEQKNFSILELPAAGI